MPSSTTVLVVALVFGPSVLYVPVIWTVRRWRRWRGLAPAGRPQVYRDPAAEAQARRHH